MSFSNANRDQIMGYLGIPVTEDQVSYVQSILSAIALQPEAVLRVQAYLAKLASIDTQIDTARNITSTTLQTGAVTQSPYNQLLAEGQRVVRLLSASIGIEPRTNIYSNPQ